MQAEISWQILCTSQNWGPDAPVLHTGEGGEQVDITWRSLYASQNGWRGLDRNSFKSHTLPTYYTPIMPASCTLDPSALRWTAGGPGSWLVTLESNRLEVGAHLVASSDGAASSLRCPAARLAWAHGIDRWVLAQRVGDACWRP